MATNRTINFYGYAYGSVPVQLNAHINGELVFSGTVPTIDAEMPLANKLDMSSAPVLFAVADSSLFPVDFAGSYPMTLSIATGTGVLQCNTFSNYMAKFDPVAKTFAVGSADVFADMYNGVPVNSDSTTDSRSSVFIDAVAVPQVRTPETDGQWTVEVLSGSTMSCQLSIAKGSIAPPAAVEPVAV
jgi:hypothetical protein